MADIPWQRIDREDLAIDISAMNLTPVQFAGRRSELAVHYLVQAAEGYIETNIIAHGDPGLAFPVLVEERLEVFIKRSPFVRDVGAGPEAGPRQTGETSEGPMQYAFLPAGERTCIAFDLNAGPPIEMRDFEQLGTPALIMGVICANGEGDDIHEDLLDEVRLIRYRGTGTDAY